MSSSTSNSMTIDVDRHDRSRSIDRSNDRGRSFERARGRARARSGVDLARGGAPRASLGGEATFEVEGGRGARPVRPQGRYGRGSGVGGYPGSPIGGGAEGDPGEGTPSPGGRQSDRRRRRRRGRDLPPSPLDRSRSLRGSLPSPWRGGVRSSHRQPREVGTSSPWGLG
jgi:hypothetical protein